METYLIDYDMGDLLFVVTCIDEGTPMIDVLATAIVEVTQQRECLIEPNAGDIDPEGDECSVRCYSSDMPKGEYTIMHISPIKVIHV